MLGTSKEYDLTGRVIGAAMKVHSALGPRFVESVYQNALIWESQKGGLKAEAGRAISVRYDGQIVGAFTADLLVNDCLIIELKATQSLAKAHEVQPEQNDWSTKRNFGSQKQNSLPSNS